MQLPLPTAFLTMLLSLHGANMKSTLQAKYDAISNAFMHQDSSIFDHIYAPKYVLIGTSGHKIERKELLSDYKDEMSQFSDITWPRTLDDVVVAGSTATVTVHGKFRGTRTTKDGKHLFESTTVTKDTWTRQGGSWVLLKSQMISMDATYDHRKLRKA